MGKFRANTDDAYILTNIQNQESGDSDWVQYQVITKDKPRLYLHSNTTNILLKVFKYTTQVHDIFGDGSAVATYTFDDNANDLGGNHNGTWNGTEQYDIGIFGQAAKFDGNNYIALDDDLKDLIATQTFSISFWHKNYNGPIIATSHYTPYYNYGRKIYPNAFYRWTGESGTTQQLVVDYSFTSDVFYNVVITFDVTNGTTKIYINNELVGSKTLSTSSSGADPQNSGLNFGVIKNTNTYATGILDQVRIFNRVLTEDEIALLYYEGLIHIRKHDQLIIYNATDRAKIHEVTFVIDNDTDKTYDIDISSLSLLAAPTNAYQLTKLVDLTDKIDTSNTTATTLVLQDALENPTLIKNGKTLVIDGNKLENITVTRSLDGGNIKYSIDISSLNRVPSEVALIKPRVEISVGDEDKANADDLVLDVLDSTITSITVGYYEESNKRVRIKNAEKVDTDTGLDLSLIEVVEEYLDPTKVDPFNDNSEVAFYQLDGNANDAHNQYNGTWSGTEQYDTGKFGQAAKFDGSSAIDWGSSIFSGDRSYSVWIKTSSEGNSDSPLDIIATSCFNNTSTDKGEAIRVYKNNDNNLIVEMQQKNADESNFLIQVPFVYNDGNWHHIVGIYDETSIILFIDGKKKGSKITKSGISTQGYNRIGCSSNGSNNIRYFNGLIDQVRIFNRALTEDEVKYLYNEGKYKFNLNLQSEQSSAPTIAIIRPTIQDILELDLNNTAYDNTNDLVNVYYQPIQKRNGFRSVQVKWNAHRQGDENNNIRVNLWKKVV